MKKLKIEKRYWIFIIFIVVLIVALFLAGKAGLNYLDELVFSERQSQLQEVVTQFYHSIDSETGYSWEKAEETKNRFLANGPDTVQGVSDFFSSETQLDVFAEMGADALAITDEGRFIDKSGLHGLVCDNLEPLLEDKSQVSYLFDRGTEGKMYNLFVFRLETPQTVVKGKNSYNVRYVGITREMDTMRELFRCSAYGGKNSTYIVDRNGFKQFSDSADAVNLIEATNVYKALDDALVQSGKKLSDVLEKANSEGSAFSTVTLNGEECFYSIRKMENTDFSIIYVNPSKNVAVSTQQLVNSVILIFMIVTFSVLLAIVLGTAVIVTRNRKQLVLETQAKERFRKINEQLDETNAELIQTTEAAQAAYKAAKNASESKSSFLSNMSHDIRTPMNAIINIARLMKYDSDSPQKIDEYCDKILSSGELLLGIVNDVLDMSKIESGKAVLDKEKVNLAEVLDRIESIVGAQANEKGQRLTISVNDVTHEDFYADSARLDQLLMNILGNSVKYTPKGGNISLAVTGLPERTKDYECLSFVIEDNGIGMSKDFLEHIFEPFSRQENSVTNKVQGTGLGMAIVKNVVDMMGGVITVDSEQGKGSRFEVVLEFEIDKDKEVLFGGEIKKVMAVCKNAELIGSITKALGASGIAVTANSDCTKTDDEMLIAADKSDRPYDLILVEYDEYREQIFAASKGLNLLEHKPIIILMGNGTRNTAKEALQQGVADGFIELPFFTTVLEREVDVIKNGKRSEVEEHNNALKGMRFLCAEDNDINAEILEALLNMEGATCKICDNGQKVVDEFNASAPGDYDMILMDVQMPVLNGYDATRAIRNSSHPSAKTIPIVAMTANAFSDDVQNSLNSGMNAHLSKPIDMNKLKNVVQRLLTPPPPKTR